MILAHSQNHCGFGHSLEQHLREVARLAQERGEKICAPELGYWAGLWHDLGKAHPEFQAYLQENRATRGPDHKAAGAIFATQKGLDCLAFLIKGHHGGLPSRADLKGWLADRRCNPDVQAALAIASKLLPQLAPECSLSFPDWLKSKSSTEFFLRMLFSCLVDADFLDTEQHFHPDRSELRSRRASLEELWRAFQAYQQQRTGHKDDLVNRTRHEVYLSCLRAAEESQGIFRLTVPTGGGKTRSALGFALRHALRHGLDRVIFAIPYTSIIEQTADEFRKIFGPEPVLEHHCAVSADEDPDHPSPQEMWRRLAAENWEAPLVVTTTVQLFESLFAHRPAACRKLHNVARSVIILDEAQMLPPELLDPILDALNELVSHYRVTVVLSTATQPALSAEQYAKGLPGMREIVGEPHRLFAALRRVRYEWLGEGKAVSWSDVAAQMHLSDQVLVIVNTKGDALALLDTLNDPDALHLSTLLCGAHRRDVLREIRRRLDAGSRCRVVSTQVVEAGVDLDFPVVLRAVGPLDRIVQAAGRCNREGRLNGRGRFVLFHPQDGRQPPGTYTTGTGITASLARAGNLDFHNPAVYETYFARLFESVNCDAQRIQELRTTFDYPEVAARFRIIADDAIPVIVRYREDGRESRVEELVKQMKSRSANPRLVFRDIQPFLVDVRRKWLDRYEREGVLREIVPGVWEWLGAYDRVRGLSTGASDPAELVV